MATIIILVSVNAPWADVDGDSTTEESLSIERDIQYGIRAAAIANEKIRAAEARRAELMGATPFSAVIEESKQL